MTPNGEVEGPPRSARLEPRVHTLFPHPRRHYRRSRTPPTIVRRRDHYVSVRTRPSRSNSDQDAQTAEKPRSDNTKLGKGDLEERALAFPLHAANRWCILNHMV